VLPCPGLGEPAPISARDSTTKAGSEWAGLEESEWVGLAGSERARSELVAGSVPASRAAVSVRATWVGTERAWSTGPELALPTRSEMESG
jgi:hypothetical protein